MACICIVSFATGSTCRRELLQRIQTASDTLSGDEDAGTTDSICHHHAQQASSVYVCAITARGSATRALYRQTQMYTTESKRDADFPIDGTEVVAELHSASGSSFRVECKENFVGRCVSRRH